MRDRFRSDTQRRGVRIVERDLAMVEAVWEARYMTTQQLATLFFASYQTAKKRVRKLFDARYLAKRAAYINEPDIYYLGLRGKRHIMASRDYSKEYVERMVGVSGGGTKAPLLFMEHELTLSELYVKARTECQQHELELRWRNARMLEEDALGVQPDAWLEVAKGDRAKAAYLEFTREYPKALELRHKLDSYEALFERLGPVQVLWFMTSKRKAHDLMDSIARRRCRDCFCVGLIDQSRGFLTRPIWRWSESTDMISFIIPQKGVREAGQASGLPGRSPGR